MMKDERCREARNSLDPSERAHGDHRGVWYIEYYSIPFTVILFRVCM